MTCRLILTTSPVLRIRLPILVASQAILEAVAEGPSASLAHITQHMILARQRRHSMHNGRFRGLICRLAFPVAEYELVSSIPIHTGSDFPFLRGLERLPLPRCGSRIGMPAATR